jgi:hypothetical protein
MPQVYLRNYHTMALHSRFGPVRLDSTAAATVTVGARRHLPRHTLKNDLVPVKSMSPTLTSTGDKVAKRLPELLMKSPTRSFPRAHLATELLGEQAYAASSSEVRTADVGVI